MIHSGAVETAGRIGSLMNKSVVGINTFRDYIIMKVLCSMNAFVSIIRIAVLCFLLLLCVCYNNADSASIEDYFSVVESSSVSVHIKCRLVVSDTSAEWARLLLAGFIYASSISGNTEKLSVTFQEQDGYIYTYTVRKTDLKYFIDESITFTTFLKRINMRKSR
jgi:hypothetical protein